MREKSPGPDLVPISVLPYVTQSIVQHYKLGKEIGRGGFGVVRECVQRSTGKQFACKSVTKSDAYVCQELRGEINVQRYLSNHANVVALHEVFEDNAAVHLVMDLCTEGDLDAFIRRLPERRLEESVAARLFVQIADAVRFCHASGVMHRDIKPKNILLTCCGAPKGPPARNPKLLSKSGQPKSDCKNDCGTKPCRTASRTGAPPAAPARAAAPTDSEPGDSRVPSVKLADFGRSVFLHEGQLTSGLVCTYHFAAPEAIPVADNRLGFGSRFKSQGGRYGFEADIWSLGVTLYLLLSGALPFDSETSDEDLFAAIQSGNVDVRSGHWEKVSSPAKGLVLRMLSLDPKRRLTIDKVLEHPWIQTHSQSPSRLQSKFSVFGIASLSPASSRARASSRPPSGESAPSPDPDLRPIALYTSRRESKSKPRSKSRSESLDFDGDPLRPPAGHGYRAALSAIRMSVDARFGAEAHPEDSEEKSKEEEGEETPGSPQLASMAGCMPSLLRRSLSSSGHHVSSLSPLSCLDSSAGDVPTHAYSCISKINSSSLLASQDFSSPTSIYSSMSDNQFSKFKRSQDFADSEGKPQNHPLAHRLPPSSDKSCSQGKFSDMRPRRLLISFSVQGDDRSSSNVDLHDVSLPLSDNVTIPTSSKGSKNATEENDSIFVQTPNKGVLPNVWTINPPLSPWRRALNSCHVSASNATNQTPSSSKILSSWKSMRSNRGSKIVPIIQPDPDPSNPSTVSAY